jgi:hypothetical protein
MRAGAGFLWRAGLAPTQVGLLQAFEDEAEL